MNNSAALFHKHTFFFFFYRHQTFVCRHNKTMCSSFVALTFTFLAVDTFHYTPIHTHTHTTGLCRNSMRLTGSGSLSAVISKTQTFVYSREYCIYTVINLIISDYCKDNSSDYTDTRFLETVN